MSINSNVSLICNISLSNGSFPCNFSSDESGEDERNYESIPSQSQIIISILLVCFSLITVFGNTLVMWAVAQERYLHTATNYFVTSLALADCLVGLVVMPISAFYEVLGRDWNLGIGLCDLWRSLDVLFSTASILNLCVISVDRYWAVTEPFKYGRRMNHRRVMFLIASVWTCSAGISFPAILWWRAVRPLPPPRTCPFTKSPGYLVFSSAVSFYLPLCVMAYTYFKIYQAAVEQSRSLRTGWKRVSREVTLRMHRGGGAGAPASGPPQPPPHTPSDDDPPSLSLLKASQFHSRKLSRFAKEKKAAKTLGIVMGVFVVCWLPFFLINLLSAFCVDCFDTKESIAALVNWLGWINSGMNPVIYACWSKDFRRQVKFNFIHLFILFH